MPGKPNRSTSSSSDDEPLSRTGRPSGGSGSGRIGLVLGGGGILGGAWLVGALAAFCEASEWDPRTATHIVGTSAGSVVAALVAAGIPVDWMVHHQRGGSVDGLLDDDGQPFVGAEDQPFGDADESSRELFAWSGQVPRPVLGSPGLLLRSALRPWKFPPTTALSGWLGRGFLSNSEVGRMISVAVPEGWPDHPNLWIVTVDYSTGRRVVFGAPDAPSTDLWRAVRASCAIPGLYRPFEIDGRTYIDGGAWSPSNADLLARTDVDSVIVLNPMSSLYPGLPTSFLERFDRTIRRRTGRRLGREARRLREASKQVLLIQPRKPDLDVMGVNLMDPTRRVEVLETALRTTAARLHEPDARAMLARLAR